MARSIYLVNPAADSATYYGAELLAGSGLPSGTAVADLAAVTIAALAPSDFEVAIGDENIAPIDFDHPAEWIGITGKVNQRRRMRAIADEFHRRGKRVIIGGPYASLSPEAMRPHCDVLVRGEAEEIGAGLFADLRSGRVRDEYVGDKPDLALSPLPRWDLYANQRALIGTLQTSRGCPFECEFCDVIQYLGRKQRHKPIANVLAELDQLYRHGYQTIFLADDNFTAYRRRCKELLEAVAWWRREHQANFVTQVSVDAARDPELLDMCAEAGLIQVFIGIETTNEESLRETKKRQNLHVDLAEQVQLFIDHGISVMAGMIAGFDADGPDVFRQQYEFAMSTAVPIFSISALVAPDATPLHARLARDGRLIQDGDAVEGVPWDSNIRPQKMSAEELSDGLRRLCNAIYAPEAFGERTLRFIERFGRARRGAVPGTFNGAPARAIDAQALQVALDVRRLGDAESRMWQQIWSAVSRRPEVAPFVTRILFQYAQIRFMFRQQDYWDPQLARTLN